jgi:hypothetical protein
MRWLLFLPQLPASPSTLRVMVWRRMRAAGAFGLQNGVWVLPQSAAQVQYLNEILLYLQDHEASGYIFEVSSMNQSIEADLINGFRADRDEEYTEFSERCQALLAEIERETRQGKFSFAELEETEADLDKLKGWLDKIKTRDFFEADLQAAALGDLERCQMAYQTFASQVYASQGIEPADHPAA